MARTGGKRNDPRTRPSARPAPVKPTLPTTEEQPSGLGKKVLLVGAGLVALAVLVVIGIGLASEEASEPEREALLLPDVSVSGSFLPPHAGNDSPDTAIGLPAPEVTSSDFSGLPASIVNDGTPKMIVFLAHWCQFCQQEVPALQGWIDANGIPAGVDLVSVATSISEIRPNYPPDAWLRREGWTPRVVVDDTANSISRAYGLNAFPYYVMVDGGGNVVRRISGGVPADVAGAFLQSLAAGG